MTLINNVNITLRVILILNTSAYVLNSGSCFARKSSKTIESHG